MGDGEYPAVAKTKKLRGIISSPDYARDDDSLDALMAKEVPIYAAHGEGISGRSISGAEFPHR